MITLGIEDNSIKERMNVSQKCSLLYGKDALIMTNWTFMIGEINSMDGDSIYFKIKNSENQESIKIIFNEIVWVSELPMFPIGKRLAIVEIMEYALGKI